MFDKANQLIRENLYYGSGNSNNATYTYTYDNWGNLLTRKKYIYSPLNNLSEHALQDTVTYTYGDSNWKDKLTSFNGSTIPSFDLFRFIDIHLKIHYISLCQNIDLFSIRDMTKR